MDLNFKSYLISLVVLLLSGTVSLQAPAAMTRQYELGTVYEYSYETSVLLNEPLPKPISSAKDVGFRVKLQSEISAVWQHSTQPNEQILLVTVLYPKLAVKAQQGNAADGFVDKSSKIDSFKSLPLFVYWNNGRIGNVFTVRGEDISIVNLKKGIASLLQVSVQDVDDVEEVDASGRCRVQYVAGDRSLISKIKRNCVPAADSLFFNNTNKVLGAAVTSSVVVSYELRPVDKIILSASGMETHFLKVAAKQSSASEVISRQSLKLTGERKVSLGEFKGSTESDVIKAISKKFGYELVTSDLSTEEDKRDCIACKTLQELVTNFKSTLKPSNLGTQSSALAFVRLIRKMRESSKEEIADILNNKKNGKILPQLVDIVASTQTIASHKAAMSFINFQEETKITVPERYLVTVSLSTHPSATVIQDLFDLAKRGVGNSHLQETLVYTVSSLLRTYSLMPGHADKPLVAEITGYLEERVQKCETVPCQLMYVSGLKNAQQRQSLPVILKVIRSAPRKVSIKAMRALQTMPGNFINQTIVKELERIFYGLDRKYDSSVKVISADILLQHNPSEKFLKKLLEGLSDQKSKELNTVLLSKIHDLVDKGDKNLLLALKKLLKDPTIGNYHLLSQNGLSSAFSRPLSIGSTVSANLSFTNVLEISGGLLKRSTVDVFVDNNNDRLKVLSFGIFAGGLDMFGGTEEATDDDDEVEEANAGIEFTLMETQLRPYIFFTSKGELMGHVWSGTASERTTALQGLALLQDHQQRVPLQNGFSVEMLLTGAISYDFAGQVQISLWSQNAHSLVEIGAGMVIQGQARVDTSFVQTMIEFNAGVQTRLDFVSDLTFSSGIAMCMKMSQPDYDIVENVRKLERIPGSSYVLKKYKRRQVPSPGKTYVINKKNTMLCNKMFYDSQ